MSRPNGDRSGAPILELQDIRAGYGGITAVHGVSLSVRAGEVVALLGPNGAGKSTTQKVAAGVHPAQGGRLRYAGKDVTGIGARDAARAGVCLIPEGRGVFPNLSVRENLWMMTFTGRSREQIETDAYERFPILARRAKQTAGTMSGGMSGGRFSAGGFAKPLIGSFLPASSP